jgi:sarcosine oxidase delta subunit
MAPHRRFTRQLNTPGTSLTRHHGAQPKDETVNSEEQIEQEEQERYMRELARGRYIGDGVYASFDGYQIWVKAQRDGMTHEIALEPHVFVELMSYASNFYKGVKV